MSNDVPTGMKSILISFSGQKDAGCVKHNEYWQNSIKYWIDWVTHTHAQHTRTECIAI